MMRRMLLIACALVLVLATHSAAPGPLAAQEEGPAGPGDERKSVVQASASAGPAPAVGAPILEDPLTGPGVLWAGGCASKRNSREFVGDGLRFRITGKCSENESRAAVDHLIPRLQVPDGEVRLELRAASAPSHVD